MDVYDFDGTLIGVNSFTEVCKATLRQCVRRFRPFRVMAVGLLFVRRRLFGLAHMPFKIAMMRHFEASFSEDERRALIQSIYERFLNHEVRDALHQSGDCVVTTAAPYAYMGLLDFGREVTLICSLSPLPGIVDASNLGEGKVRNLQSLLGTNSLEIDHFYTDDLVADAPLAKLARQVHLVNGGQITALTNN